MSLANKSFSVLLRDVLLLGTNVLTSVVIARNLGPHMLGLWVVLNLIPSYAETLGRLKADAGAIYFLGSGLHAVGDVVFALNVIAVVSGVVIVLPVLIGFDWFSQALFGADVAVVHDYIYVMVLQVPVNFLYMNYVYLHIQREDVRSLNIMVMTRALLASTLIVLGLLGFGLGLTAVVFGQFIGVTLSVVIGVGRYGFPARGPGAFRAPVYQDLLRYGGKLYIGNAVSYLNTYSSQAIVVAFCAPAQVAFFSIAQQVGQLVSKVTEAMGNFLFSRIAKTPDVSESSGLAARAFRVSLVVLVPGVIGAAVLMKPALLLLYGTRYLEVLPPFLIIVPGLTLLAAASTLSMFFQGIGRADLVAKIAFLPFLLQLTVGLLLVQQLEIVGAAFGFLLALLATAILQIVVFVKLTGLPARQLWPGREDVATVIDFIRRLLRLDGASARMHE